MIFAYLFVLFSLSIYSYSQIDLNLTLLQTPWFLAFKDLVINLGYYNRPLSTIFFLIILLLMYWFYWKLVIGNWKLVIGVIGVLALLSYPFLSHDLFNYIFDARIITTYHLNPYFYKALDFPADDWVRFMHWTHRTYPYGPVWLLITIIPSFLGFGKFILTLLNFKLLFTGAYLLNCYLVSKINPQNLKFFALNPLIILETLYSPHNEALMLTFFLLGVYFSKNKVLMLVSLLLSGGVKFITWLAIPPLLSIDKVNARAMSLSIVLISLGLVPVILGREMYPWYLVTIIGLAALTDNKNLQKFLGIFSFGLLLRYVLYLYTGLYSSETILAQNTITVTFIFIALLTALHRSFTAGRN
jgi:hypothetical protein